MPTDDDSSKSGGPAKLEKLEKLFLRKHVSETFSLSSASATAASNLSTPRQGHRKLGFARHKVTSGGSLSDSVPLLDDETPVTSKPAASGKMTRLREKLSNTTIGKTLRKHRGGGQIEQTSQHQRLEETEEDNGHEYQDLVDDDLLEDTPVESEMMSETEDQNDASLEWETDSQGNAMSIAQLDENGKAIFSSTGYDLGSSAHTYSSGGPSEESSDASPDDARSSTGLEDEVTDDRALPHTPEESKAIKRHERTGGNRFLPPLPRRGDSDKSDGDGQNDGRSPARTDDEQPPPPPQAEEKISKKNHKAGPHRFLPHLHRRGDQHHLEDVAGRDRLDSHSPPRTDDDDSARKPKPHVSGPHRFLAHLPRRGDHRRGDDDEEESSRRRALSPTRTRVNKSGSKSPRRSRSPAHDREKVSEKINKMRRRLNPRSHAAKWRFRIDEAVEEHHEGGQHDAPITPRGSGDEMEADAWELSSVDDGGRTDESMSAVSTEGDQEQQMNSNRRQWKLSKATDISELTLPNVESPAGNETFGLPPDASPYRRFRFDKREYRVKPYHCFRAPVFMTEEEIYTDMLRPSEHVEFLESFLSSNRFSPKSPPQETTAQKIFWGSSDDGRVGSLRVEILGCIGLGRNKPDIAAFAVCGDCAFSTDVLQGSRSPMWPCKSKRAAVFPIHHAYAELFVGVFDIMPRHENDAFCGRVVIDLSSLRPDTEFDVTMPLRASSFIYDERARGVIRLRFSLHWFQERAAVLSYLATPQNLAAAVAEAEDSPSIPCADPKTFRNIAVTVHGQDLPGKYTRRAFQATMREFNLYQINLRFLAKAIVLDTMMWLNPILSGYVFCFWMYAVAYQSVRYIPAFFVGVSIIMMVGAYWKHNRNCKSNLGYPPLSMQELLLSLFSFAGTRFMEPLHAKKKVRQRPVSIVDSKKKKKKKKQEEDATDETTEIAPLDHREFPFSEKFEYPKRPVEESLVAHSHRNHKKETKAMVGRLSMYVSSELEIPIDEPSEHESKEFDMMDFEEAGEQGLDPDSVMGDVDSVCLLDPADFEFVDAEVPDDELDACTIGRTAKHLAAESEAILSSRRIPTGPIQNSDLKPKKRVPPQVHLARVENLFNNVTLGLSCDRFFFSTLSMAPHTPIGPQNDSSEEAATPVARSRKRTPLDDFDKRLGLRARHPNPVTEITSSYLGPLMRIFRVINFIVRVGFNIGIWRDPYMSFWVLCGLIVLFFILLVFPWRSCFFLAGIVLFGPQNILFRRNIEKRFMSPKRRDGSNASEDAALVTDPNAVHRTTDKRSIHSKELGSGKESNKVGPRQKIKALRERLKERRKQKRIESRAHFGRTDTVDLSEAMLFERPSFVGANVKGGTPGPPRKNMMPREVLIPYSRFRKERFYFWPPDPTVARATPIDLQNPDQQHLAMSHVESENSIVNLESSYSSISSTGQGRLRLRKAHPTLATTQYQRFEIG